MYMSKDDIISRQTNDYLSSKAMLIESVENLIKEHKNVLPELKMLKTYFSYHQSKYPLELINIAEDALQPVCSNTEQALTALSRANKEIEYFADEFILDKDVEPKSQGSYKVKMMYKNSQRKSRRQYLVFIAEFSNPYNIEQLKKAPIRHRFTMHVYDAYNIGYGPAKEYNHNPLKKIAKAK